MEGSKNWGSTGNHIGSGAIQFINNLELWVLISKMAKSAGHTKVFQILRTKADCEEPQKNLSKLGGIADNMQVSSTITAYWGKEFLS